MGLIKKKIYQKDKVLRTLDLLKHLENFNPKQTPYVNQYFFLENVALPLVVNHYTKTTGYETALVHSWFRPDPKTWNFFIKKGLKFSDGSPLTLDYIFHELKSIQKKESFHLNFIYDAKITLLKKERAILFRFPYPLQDEFLFELSRMDAGILHPRNKQGDWSISSGAYFLKKKTKEQGKRVWILKKNPYFALQREKMPKEVKIYDIDIKNIARDFLKFKINFLMGFPGLNDQRKLLRKYADKTEVGFPTFLSMFYFCPFRSSLAKNISARRAFFYLVHQAVKLFKKPNFKQDYQLVPQGYPSRLMSYEAPKATASDLKYLRGKNLYIVLVPFWRMYPSFVKTLKSVFKKQGIELSILFFPLSENEKKLPIFAENYKYLADQKDPLSAFSFLVRAHGILDCFEGSWKKRFQKLIPISSRALRWFELKKFHKDLLDAFVLAPFGFEGVEYFLSSNISIDAFNPFDMHPRYYDVVLKTFWF